MLKSYDIIIQNKYFVSNRGRKIIQNTANTGFFESENTGLLLINNICNLTGLSV